MRAMKCRARLTIKGMTVRGDACTVDEDDDDVADEEHVQFVRDRFPEC